MVIRLLRRKFCIQPEMEAPFTKLPLLPLETLENIIEASQDWTESAEFTVWLDERLAECQG